MIQFSIFTVAEVSYSALALLTSAREQKEETCLNAYLYSAATATSPSVLLEHCIFLSQLTGWRLSRTQPSVLRASQLVRGSAPAKPAQRQDK